MSDFINGIGARGPAAYGLGGPRTAGSAGGSAPSEEATGSSASGSVAAPEGFAPTAEAGESNQDTKAGEARASQIFSAWAPSSAPPTPSAGQLDIQGAGNTTVNQVHGVQNGQHVGSQGPDAGFSGGTVYSSKPPG